MIVSTSLVDAKKSGARYQADKAFFEGVLVRGVESKLKRVVKAGEIAWLPMGAGPWLLPDYAGSLCQVTPKKDEGLNRPTLIIRR